MDQTIRDLIVGVASSGLWSLLADAGVRGAQRLREQHSNTELITHHLRDAVESVTEHFALGEGPERTKLITFLGSPEVEAIVRQLYAYRMVVKDGEADATTDSIRREFIALMSIHVDIAPERLHSAADPLFHALVTACNTNLRQSLGQGKLGAHEALSQYRHRRLMDELAVIDRNVAMLASGIRPDITSILTFEEKYRRQVGIRHSYIQPPHFDAAKKVPIDTLFVTPTFWSTNRRKALQRRSKSADIELASLVRDLYRLVLLGNPGGGKSTFATKLVHDMATRYNARPVADRLLTPVLIVLREYGRVKKNLNCSILHFIEIQATSNYQVDPPLGAFEYLLLNGRVFVVFDGLDELLDTAYRQEISADVESFCALYPNVPVLVTSREVGYDQAPLEPHAFPTLRIAPFEVKQVEEYSQKWFARDEDYPKEQRQRKAQAFLAESEVAPDLRSNPLILGLMCNLYKVEGYIPRNRADVYEKCSIMLFERWDKGRGILVQLPFEAHVRPAMQHLAYWIYADETLQTGVTRGNLIEQTTEYLSIWVFDQPAEARLAANEFVAFCTGRAWVFTDTGTTADGEKLYQFTHRTFLEYFAASHLTSIYPTPISLAEILLPRIRKQEWDVVAILAFQIQSRRVQGGADNLLKRLIDSSQPLPEQAACIAFAGRCLESIVPSPNIRREIAAAAVDLAVRLCVEPCDLKSAADTTVLRRAPAVTVLAPVLSASIENRPTLAAVLRERLTTVILNADDSTSLAALEIALTPAHFTRRNHRVSSLSDSKFWREIFTSAVPAVDPRTRQLAATDSTICITLVLRNLLPIEELIRWHRPASIFRKRIWRCVSGPPAPIASFLLARLFSAAVGEDSIEQDEAKEMASLGRCLLKCDPPWVPSTELDAKHEELFSDPFPYYIDPPRNTESNKDSRFSPDELFGAFCLLAAMSEMRDYRIFRDQGRVFKAVRFSNLRLAIRIASARSMPINATKLDKLTHGCGFDAAQSDFVRRWAIGDFNLTEQERGVQLHLPTSPDVDASEMEFEDIEDESEEASTDEGFYGVNIVGKARLTP